MTVYGPELLRADHILDGFDCGQDDLNRWLIRRAWRSQADDVARVWVLADESRVIGYQACCAAQVLRGDLPSAKARRNQPEAVPAVLLARLAVDGSYRRLGYGTDLLEHFTSIGVKVAEGIGVRVLLVNAIDDTAADFYLHHGYARSPVQPMTLTFLLRDLTAP